jgi:hypothetical protein
LAAPPKRAEPWVVGGAGANRMAQTRLSRPGNSRGPRPSSAMAKASHSRKPSHISPGQPVKAWKRARGSQLAGRATSNSSEKPTAGLVPSRSAKRREPTTTRITATPRIPIKVSGMAAKARAVRAWYPA